jgi:hypothetical protein
MKNEIKKPRKTELIQATVPKETKDHIVKMAKISGCSVAEFINYIIDRYFENK